MTVNEPITRLTEVDIAKSARILANAFHDDPPLVYAIPNAVERAKLLPYFYDCALQIGMKYGQVFGLGDPIAAVAMWYPPEVMKIYHHPLPLEDEAVLAGRLPDTARERFDAVVSCLESYHKCEVPLEHWYLSLLGVEVSKQGQGLGRHLITPTIEAAVDSGHAVYLETFQPKNVPFYESLGFRLCTHGTSEIAGLDFFTFRLG